MYLLSLYAFLAWTATTIHMGNNISVDEYRTGGRVGGGGSEKIGFVWLQNFGLIIFGSVLYSEWKFL